MPGGTQGVGPSLSMMSDMLAPLTNVEELDKRDHRHARRRAMAQAQPEHAAIGDSGARSAARDARHAACVRRVRADVGGATRCGGRRAESDADEWLAASGGTGRASPTPAEPAAQSDAAADKDEEEAPAAPAFDASAWWNLLQSQFNQIAQFAVTHPATAAAGETAATDPAQDAAAASATPGAPSASAEDAKPATRRPAAKRAPASAKRAGGAGAGGSTAKKSI